MSAAVMHSMYSAYLDFPMLQSYISRWEQMRGIAEHDALEESGA